MHTCKWTDREMEIIQLNYMQLEHKDIALILNRSENAVRGLCHKMGWRKKVSGWTQAEEDYLRAEYAHAEIHLDIIAKTLGHPKTSVARKARELGLTNQRRSKTSAHVKKMGEKARKWHKNHEHPRGNLGHNHSEQTKAVMSRKSKEAWADPNFGLNSEENKQRLSDLTFQLHLEGRMVIPHSRGSAGKRADLGGLYVRSSWEANYARYLNWLVDHGEIASWEYEPDTFVFEAIKRGTRSYMPDFKVVNNDGSVEYHEVKGWMDQKSTTKLNRMAKYYPEVKIVLIDEAAYDGIRKSAQKLIPHWEVKGQSYEVSAVS